MWNLDDESIVKICRSFANNELVAKLRISYPSGRVVFKWLNQSEPELIEKTGQVTYGGEILGHIEIDLTLRLLRENNRQLLWSSSTALVAAIVVLIGVTVMLLRVFLKKPFDQLVHQMGQIAEGDYERISQLARHREAETVLSKFNRMAEKIQRRENRLTEINVRLESEIQAREAGGRGDSEAQRKVGATGITTHSRTGNRQPGAGFRHRKGPKVCQ